MRNLKRALSLALAMVMVLSMMVIGAGAASLDDFSDKDEIVNKEAVTVLSTLNVINGKDDGSYDPTGIVTRAEMAKIICVVLNGGKDPSLGSTVTNSYTDTVGHWAAAYIEYCSNLGIVAGDGTGNFNPNATVTGSEAAKMLLVAAGYQSAIEGFTGANWAVATNVRANQVGLYDGLAINPSEGLSRDNAAQMVYNALSANVVTYEYTLISDGSSLSSIPELKDKNVTVLAEKFGVVTVEGVVTANEYADLNGGKAMDEGETRIVVTNHDDGQSAYTDGAKTFNVSSGKDVLGRSVTIFVKPSTTAASTSTKGTVIGSVITNSDNTVVVDSGRDSLADLADDNKLGLDYTTGEGDTFATQYVTNYGATEGNLTEAKTEEDGVRGEVRTIIDNNDDGVVDYVLTERFLLGKVTSYSTKDDGSIKLNSSTNLEYDAEDVVGFDDVAKGDFVLAIEYGGKLYVEVPETVTGELQSFSTSKATVKVDDTTYDISDIVPSVTGADKETYAIYDYLAEDNILGTTATYYFDNNGYVVAVCDADETYGNYAVILSKQAYEAGSGTSLGKDARVKVLLADGTIDTYDVYSIDGKKPGETGYTAKETDVNQYDIYSYAITDDGDIKLGTERGPVTTTTSGMSYTKGSSTLSLDGTKYAVTSSTVFLYYDGSDVTRFVGKTSSDIDLDGSVKMAVATSYNNPKEAAVVFVNDTAEPQYDGNYLYIYKEKVTKNSDGYEADVILADGTIETITIDSTTFEAIQHDDGGMKVNAGMYRYSVSDDVYSLETTAADGLVISGTITATRSDYITVGDSYTLTSDTIVAYGATNKTASVGEALNRGDKVAFVINEDDEVEFAVITAYAADEYEVAITGSDASNKLTYMVNDEEKTLEDGNLAVGTVLTVEAEAENMVVVDVNGNKTYLEDGDEYTLTAADTTFEVVAKPTVTLSGTSADAASVTATYSSIDGTAYMPGDEVEVVLTLSGTADAGNTVTVSVDGAEGTYTSDIETEGVVVNATSGVVISAETEVDGTVTFTFVVGAEDVTLTVGVVAVV